MSPLSLLSSHTSKGSGSKVLVEGANALMLYVAYGGLLVAELTDHHRDIISGVSLFSYLVYGCSHCNALER